MTGKTPEQKTVASEKSKNDKFFKKRRAKEKSGSAFCEKVVITMSISENARLNAMEKRCIRGEVNTQ